jgi:uncharacterized protein (TIGR03437 family)
MRRHAGVLLIWAWPAAAQTLAPGFVDDFVAAVPLPTAVAQLPDQRLLVTSQSGAVRIVEGGTLLAQPALTLAAICSNSERGLLGVAPDPDFAANGHVYLYYTYRAPGRDCGSRSPNGPVNRVSRFRMSGNTIDPASELVLIDNISSWNGNHNAGDLQFGPDGNLYISTGDAGCDPQGAGGCAGANAAARRTNTLLGKVLRITRDGGVPADNPWRGPDSARCHTGDAAPSLRCQETYAWGLRNPFRIAIDPRSATPRVFANDVGQNAWEEIDHLLPGEDYGWNVREGFCANGSTTNCSTGEIAEGRYRNPVFAYQHGVPVPGTQSSNCRSLSGGAFTPANTWRPEQEGYLFADFVCGSIFHLSDAGRLSEIARGLGGASVVHLAFAVFRGAPTLYYTTYARGGELRRLTAFVAASPGTFRRGTLAPDAIGTIFGARMAAANEIRIRDSAGADRSATLVFTSEGQVNFIIPPGIAPGEASVQVRGPSGVIGTLGARFENLFPDFFWGRTAVRVNSGSQTPVELYDCVLLVCRQLPVDVTRGDFYLTLYASGLRAARSVSVTVGGAPVPVTYFGPQHQFAGLDQVNVLLPSSLAGRGSVRIEVRADGFVREVGDLVIQ